MEADDALDGLVPMTRPLHPAPQPFAPAPPSPTRAAARAARRNGGGATHAPPLGPRAALASLTVWLDACLVTHPTGHALLPALAAAGLAHAVSRDPHPLAREAGVRSVLFTTGRAGDGDCSSSTPVPYVLACLTAADYVDCVDNAGGLAGLAATAAAAHPGATLGIIIEGLDAHLASRERADARAGLTPARGAFVRRRYDGADAAAAVRLPGVRLRLAPDALAAAEHAVGLARALALHPHKRRGDFVADFDGDSAAARAVLSAAAATDARPVVVAARALARVPGVGPAAALAVARRYGCLGGLIQAAADDADGVAADVAGLSAGRMRVGPAAAARVVAVVTGREGGMAVE